MGQFMFFLFAILSYSALGQVLVAPRSLNAYKYADVRPPRLQEKNGQQIRINDLHKTNGEVLRATAFVEELLRGKGFLIMPRDSLGNTSSEGGLLEMPLDAKQNGCLTLRWFWGYSAGVESEIGMVALNCREETVFSNKYRMQSRGESPAIAIQHLLAPLLRVDYQFDEAFNHEMFIPKVPSFKENEETLRAYFSNAKLDQIEGIYKTLGNDQNEDPTEYKIGIKKINGRFCAILLESNSSIWKEGEVKAFFETTERAELYSVTYFLSDKRKSEAFAELDDLILSVSLKTDKPGGPIKLFKIYPK